MAKYRNPDESTLSITPPSTYNIGNKPPLVNWTAMAGDSCAFRIYVEDDEEDPINVSSWTIRTQFRRYSDNVGDDLVFIVYPVASLNDGAGEFTVSLTANQTRLLETGDVFDVQLSDATRVWTVCQGEMIIIGDITDQNS